MKATEYKAVGRYVRTENGNLIETRSSIETQVGTIESVWATLERRCSWLPHGLYCKHGEPQGGWKLLDVTITPVEFDACPRCGDHITACGGPSNPHE